MKYILTLKEPLWRRTLRYTLWALIASGALTTVWVGGTAAIRLWNSYHQNEQTLKLVQYAPDEALAVGEMYFKKSPTPAARLKLVSLAVDAQAWTLADALIEPVRDSKDIPTRALNTLIEAQLAPEALGPVAALKADNGKDSERILSTKALLSVGTPEALVLARRFLMSLEQGIYHDKAALLRAQLSLKENSPQQARDVAVSLMEKNLSPRDAVTLLTVIEGLQLPEAADYRSALKVRARGSLAVALNLAETLSQSPQEAAEWLESLPPIVANAPLVLIKRASLYASLGQKDNALKALSTLPAAKRAPLESLLAGQLPEVKTLDVAQLSLCAKLANSLHAPKLELQILNALNQKSPTLWSLDDAVHAALATRDVPSIIAAYTALNKTLGGSAIVESRLAYWKLLALDGDAKALYEALKLSRERYPYRYEVRLSMALAHFRLGNLTDALLTLPENPAELRQKFWKGVLLARAGQFEQAGDLLKDIDPTELSEAELELYRGATRRLKESAPQNKLLELLSAPTPATN